MKAWLLFVCLANIFITGSLSASDINMLKSLRIMTEEWPPFQFKEQDKLTGAHIELMEIVLKNLNIGKSKKDIEMLPWARAYRAVQEDNNTVLFSMARHSSREDLFSWVGPLYGSQVALFSSTDKNIKINSMKELSKYKIAALRDDAGYKRLKSENVPDSNIKIIHKKEQAFDLLEKGRVDLWAIGEVAAIGLMKQYKKDRSKYKKVMEISNSVGNWIAFNKKTPKEIVTRFQKEVEKLKQDGTYLSILKKYDLPTDSWTNCIELKSCLPTLKKHQIK
ncbi:MAG: substrate-binding periplasmic protein [Oligoflexales bacterium]